MVTVVGHDPQAVKTVTCKECAAKLEYTLSEVKAYHGKDYSGGQDGHKWIDCPKCCNKVILESW